MNDGQEGVSRASKRAGYGAGMGETPLVTGGVRRGPRGRHRQGREGRTGGGRGSVEEAQAHSL